ARDGEREPRGRGRRDPAAHSSCCGRGAGIQRRRAPAVGAARGSSAAERPPLRARRGAGVQLWAAVRALSRSSGSTARFRRRRLCYWVLANFHTCLFSVNVCPCPRCLAHYQGPLHSHPPGSTGVSGAANGALSRTPEVPISQPLAANPPWLGHEMRSQGVSLAAACAHQRETRYCTGCLIAPKFQAD
ncbi:unnamed protein product, partial [Urochloa humidicola]